MDSLFGNFFFFVDKCVWCFKDNKILCRKFVLEIFFMIVNNDNELSFEWLGLFLNFEFFL